MNSFFSPSFVCLLHRKRTLLVFEAFPTQLPPTVPLSTSLSVSSTVFVPCSEKQYCCVESLWLNLSNRPIRLTFLANYNSLRPEPAWSPEQFFGSCHMHSTGQWGLSFSQITHQDPFACVPECWSRSRSRSDGATVCSTQLTSFSELKEVRFAFSSDYEAVDFINTKKNNLKRPTAMIF